MSIRNKNKDHLKEHAGVELVTSITAPISDDPLRFWTGHATENTLINLYPFADGEYQNTRKGGSGNWAGPYHGRADLIRELAPAIQARCALASGSTAHNYLCALRAWWRLLDALEAKPDKNGQILARVESVADLHALHEAEAHQRNMSHSNFKLFLSLTNDARKLCKPRLPNLSWIAPKQGVPIRHLIPEKQAKELKIMLKQEWEAVRRTWVHHDAIRAEAQRRAAFADDPEGAAACRGAQLPPLSKEGLRLLKNWEHFQRIQQATGQLLPSGEQLREGNTTSLLIYNGLSITVMRAIIFLTVKEAETAYHLALMGCGWNPSTLARADASKPDLLFAHPKNGAQSVLAVEDEEVSMQSDKPRARGKTQYCIALKKHKASAPAIVAAYLERSAPLREQLRSDCNAAKLELDRLHAAQADQAAIEHQFKTVQTLQEGCRSVWLYVNLKGKINWLDVHQWNRYEREKRMSYLGQVLERLNQQRAARGEPPIDSVKPSDFRDIYARSLYVQSGGNILAVMLALGHSSTKSTDNYLDNNIFSAENDEHARRFMTALFAELEEGRVDLTILAQLVRHGPLTLEMRARLEEYRHLMRSRVGAGCADPRHPPGHIAPDHPEGKLCGTQRCLRDCPNAKFLPESIDGIAMRVEELVVMSDHLPRETWLRSEFPREIEAGEYLLTKLYLPELVTAAREKWRGKISRGEHLIPGLGPINEREAA